MICQVGTILVGDKGLGISHLPIGMCSPLHISQYSALRYKYVN